MEWNFRGDVHRRRGSLPFGLIGRQWLGPSGCSRVVMPTRAHAVDVARCCGCSVLLHSNVVQLFAAKFRVPLKCHGDALRGYALQTPDAFEKARARALVILAFPSSLPLSLLFTHCFFRFEAAASQNRQGITPRARPSLAPVPLCLLCITAQQGENKGITRAWPELSSRNFSADPNAPWRESGGEGKKRKRIRGTIQQRNAPTPIHRSDSDAKAAWSPG